MKRALPTLALVAAFAACSDSGGTLLDAGAVDAGAEVTDAARVIPKPPPDFTVPGTQMGDVLSDLPRPNTCSLCHEGASKHAPFDTWKTSLMAWGGRDPLFFAQLATARQDVPDVGYYCLRCHVPVSIVTTHAATGTEKGLNADDRDGVTCAFCHAMVDPRYVAGKSPIADKKILDALTSVPTTFGNAQFVIDPAASRRGPYDMSHPYHPTIQSAFVRSSEMCGTCHEVGNPALSKQPDGTYVYNDKATPAPSADPHTQFPLERTYSEWKLSTFATTGVSLGGLFGGEGGDLVSTCQDCHMPVAKGKGCVYGDERADLRRHDFAGASSWVLKAIAADGFADDALVAGQASADAMVQRAARLELTSVGSVVSVKVINDSGHKLPTGHIEGRRVFLGVTASDAAGKLLKEWGHWDPATGDLDEASTTIFEMEVGLSAKAAALVGFPAGKTTHMSLADSIVKDNRIPPRGFANAAFEAAGAPVVGAKYADGEHWATVDFTMPTGTKDVVVTLYYQTVTRQYVEALRDGNKTDDAGKRLFSLWEKTGRGAPISMKSAKLTLP